MFIFVLIENKMQVRRLCELRVRGVLSAGAAHPSSAADRRSIVGHGLSQPEPKGLAYYTHTKVPSKFTLTVLSKAACFHQERKKVQTNQFVTKARKKDKKKQTKKKG